MTKSKNQKKSPTLPTICSVKRDRAYQYAIAVDSGEIVAGPYVRGSCRRHIKDVDRAYNDPSFRFYFDPVKADRAYRFFESVLVLSGGQHEGRPFLLIDWQSFVVGSLFGWVRKPWIADNVEEVGDHCRRFNVAYVETPKGSGKSPLAGGIGLIGQVSDNEAYAEIYAAATKKDQAKVLFKDALAFYDKSPKLQERLIASGTGPNRWRLYHEESHSSFEVISSDDKGMSGPRPHVVLVDELHEHKDGTVIDMLKAGFKFRRQPLQFNITNSGSDRTSVCWEHHTFGIKIACGEEENDEYFSYICGFDQEDMEDDKYLYDENLWFKVNPSIKKGLPGYGYVRKQVKEAKGIPSKMATVKRLNFCVWVEASNPWIDPETWFTCADPLFDESMLDGRRCWGGLDLSRTLDLTALVLVWEPSEKDPVWRLKSYFWAPGETIMEKREKDHVPYDVWRDKGWLFAPPFKFIKRSYIARFIQDIYRKYALEGVGCDPAMINEFYADAINEGVDLVEGRWNKDEKMWEFPNFDGIKIMPIGQQPKSMHPAIEKTESMLVSQQVKHDGNPCLTWCVANTVVDDSDNYRKLSKKKSTGRIDGAVAMVIACQVADVKAADKKSIYEETGVKTFG